MDLAPLPEALPTELDFLSDTVSIVYPRTYEDGEDAAVLLDIRRQYAVFSTAASGRPPVWPRAGSIASSTGTGTPTGERGERTGQTTIAEYRRCDAAGQRAQLVESAPGLGDCLVQRLPWCPGSLSSCCRPRLRSIASRTSRCCGPS